MNILMILTSHDQLGDTGKKTGFWLEEFAAPYYVFRDAGATITLASPKGGQPPLDPKSDAPDAQTPATERFKADLEANAQLAATHKLSEIDVAAYDAVFYPGGHGPMWDLANDSASIALIQDALAADKPVAAVCHAPAALKNVKNADGTPLVKGKTVTGFSNSEEDAVGLSDIVPFLLEDTLKEQGGEYSRGDDWAVHVVEDGLLITGQNPASSEEAAKRLLAKARPDNGGRVGNGAPPALPAQTPPVRRDPPRIMGDTAADDLFRAGAKLSGQQVRAERHIGRHLFGHHTLRLFDRRRPAKGERAHAHRDDHVRFRRQRPCVHSNTEPVGIMFLAHGTG